MKELVSEIRFIPIRERQGSLIGFINLVYNGDIEFKDISVHQRRDGKGYRLVYPKNKEMDREIFRPINKEAQQAIDKAITEHINNLKLEI